MADGPSLQKWCSPLQFCWHWQIPPANQVWRPLFWSPLKIYSYITEVGWYSLRNSKHPLMEWEIYPRDFQEWVLNLEDPFTIAVSAMGIAWGGNKSILFFVLLPRSKFRFMYVVVLNSSICCLLPGSPGHSHSVRYGQRNIVSPPKLFVQRGGCVSHTHWE